MGTGAAPPASAPPRAPPAMKGGRKQYSALGAVTLEKAKLDLSQRRKNIMPELATGGGGGDIGKRIGHGGGDGGDDDGDDDDYFDDFDEGEEEGGLFRRRIVVQELFNREFVEAVLQEWYKTMSDLPTGLRQACEMGLVSSAQMVRYLSIFARPTNARSFSRALPGWLSKGLVGRTLADPSFPHKMSLEFIATIASSIWCEMNIRKERFKQEWDLVIVNALTAACCNLMVLGLLAPCRSYASTSRFDFQNAIEKLPNNIFEKSYPLREFDLAKRISAFFYKAAELSLVGFVAGSVQGGMSIVLSARKERRLSVTIPSISTNALGYGAFLGLYANLRYQLLCGVDQYMVKRFDVLGVAIFFSTAARLMNIQIGEASRRTWLGEEADPQYSDRLLRAYKRPVEVDADQSRWFISKDAIVSGLGLLGIKQGGPEATFSKSRRKRVIRKKVTSG